MSYNRNYRERAEDYVDSWGGQYSGQRRSRRNDYYNARTSYERRDTPKHSGAEKGTYVVKDTGEQKPYIRGWNFSRRHGMLSFLCVPTKDIKTASPNSEKWVCKVQYEKQRPQHVTAFYHPNSGKVTIPDLQMVLNPKAPNGGYCGRFFQTRNRR